MKKIFLLFVILFIGTLFCSAQKWVEMMEDPNINFYDVQKEFYSYYVGKTKVEEAEPRMDGPYSRFKSWERYMEPRVYPTGIRPNHQAMYAEWLKQKKQESTNRAAATWSLVGPSTVPSNGGGSGKVNCVSIDPTNTQNIWLGTSGGGVWNSTDGGISWSTNTDQQLPSLTIIDLAINPTSTNIMYVSVREGIFKSTDSGVTWFNTGLNKTSYRIEIDPSNPNTILSSCVDGIYRTTDAGVTWTQVTTISASINNVDDFEFNPGNSNIVYACEYSTIKRSIDNGLTWTVVTAGLPSTPAPFGIKLAVSPANPNYVYALMTSYYPPISAGFYALCRSTDAGLTWTVMSSSPNILAYDLAGSTSGGQGAYCMSLAVSPLNANEVYVGGINLWKSTNGGVNWTNKSDWTLGTGSTYVHADQQDLKFQTGSGSILYAANDGGVFKSIDGGTTWTDLSNGLATMELYNLSSSATDPDVIVAGAQDNGTNKKSSSGFSRINYGDGLDCIIDYTDSNTIYTSLQNGALYRSVDGGTTNVYITPGFSSNFLCNYSMNPLNPNTLYAAYDNVYKTTDQGVTWTAIATGLYPASGGSFLIPVVAAPSDTNTIYVGRLTEMYRTTNGGLTWNSLTTGVAPNALITAIAVDPTDANTVWITYSGYQSYSATSTKRVFKTIDGGATWINITYSGLPAVPINCIIHQNGTVDALYVGTDLGVYYIDNTMSNWVPYNTGLPNVRVMDLDIQYTVGKLRAATFGRGIWESDLNVAVVNINDAGIPAVNSPIGTICNTTVSPMVELKNFGSATLTSATIKYQIDLGPINTFIWTGSLASFSSTVVTLPAIVVSGGAHILTAYTILPNAVVDINTANDSATTSFNYPIGLALPFYDGFENTTFPSAGMTLNNPDSWITWQRTTSTSFSGSASAFIDDMNYANDGMIDELIFPYLNFSTGNPKLTFQYAYQLRADPNPVNYFSDTLEVCVSIDCGNTWNVVYKKFDLPLVTTTPTFNPTVSFVPTLSSQWAFESIDLSAFIGNNKVLVKIKNINGRGNNLYLDDINLLNAPAGIETITLQSAVIYPNPNNGVFAIVLPTANAEIIVTDILGQQILKTQTTQKTTNLQLDNNGVYIVYVNTKQGTSIRKLIVNR